MHRIRLLLLTSFLMIASFSFVTPIKAATYIVNPKQVYTYTKMVSDIKKLEKSYPDIVKVKIIGKSEYGRSIYAISLGRGPANVFINGSHHAREWLTTTLNMYMINQYAEAHKRNKKLNGYDARSILNSSTIWFIPMVNPDGVTLQQEGLKAFPKGVHKSLLQMNEGSKNFKRWKANGKGVDLNRQYDAGWKAIRSPKGPSYKNFKGKAPHTAAETKAVLKLVTEINPEMAVSYHSTGRILFWNYKQDKARYKRDYIYASKIGKMTGYKLVNPGPNPSGGGFTDWFISAKKKPAFTPEISKPYYETSPPLSEFPGAWRENQAVGLYVAMESSNLYNNRMFQILDSKLGKLQKSSRQLRNFYSTNIKNTSDIRIDKKHSDLYTYVNKEKKLLAAKTGKLPSRYRKKFDVYYKEINNHLVHSANFIAGVKAAQNLNALQKSVNTKLTVGTLNSNTIAEHQHLSKTIVSTNAAIGKMKGAHVRRLTANKYLLPAKITKENTMYEIERFKLLNQMELKIKRGQSESVNSDLIHLEKLEKVMKNHKAKGNKLHPKKYYSFPKTEKLLLSKKIKIIKQLDSENKK